MRTPRNIGSLLIVLGLTTLILAEPPVNQGFYKQEFSQQYGALQSQSNFNVPQPQQLQSLEYNIPSQSQFEGNNFQPQQRYGPPGFNPGEPLGLSGSNFQPQSSCPKNDPQANLALVKRAYQELFGDQNLSNIDTYFAKDYIQHNPMIADGLDGLKAALNGPFGEGPKFQVDFKRTAAVDDLVWAHVRLPSEGKIFAVVDIFRIQCGKIQEHWDVLQDINVMSVNPHPFF